MITHIVILPSPRPSFLLFFFFFFFPYSPFLGSLSFTGSLGAWACMKGWGSDRRECPRRAAKFPTFFSHSLPHDDTRPHRPSTTTRRVATQAIHTTTHGFM